MFNLITINLDFLLMVYLVGIPTFLLLLLLVTAKISKDNPIPDRLLVYSIAWLLVITHIVIGMTVDFFNSWKISTKGLIK